MADGDGVAVDVPPALDAGTDAGVAVCDAVGVDEVAGVEFDELPPPPHPASKANAKALAIFVPFISSLHRYP